MDGSSTLMRKLDGRPLWLWGAGRWGRIVFQRLSRLGLRVEGFLDRRAAGLPPEILGRPVTGPDAVLGRGGGRPGGPVVVVTPLFLKDAMLEEAAALGFVRGEDLFTADDFTPNSYVVEVSGHCNLRCRACPRGRPERPGPPGGLMRLADFGLVLDKIRREDPLAANLQLYQWGEPLLNPELPAMVRLAGEAGLPVSVSSNLSLRADLESLVAARPDWFRVSVSGFGESYPRLHAGGRWDVVRDNLEALARWRAELHPAMKVEVYYHLYTYNQGEDFQAMRRLAGRLGFDFQPVWAFLISLDEVLEWREGTPLPDEARRVADLMGVDLETALARAEADQDEPCPVENILLVDWNRSVPHCLMYYYRENNQAAADYLTTPLAEIKARRRASPLCARCRARAMHRYCHTYYNWPVALGTGA